MYGPGLSELYALARSSDGELSGPVHILKGFVGRRGVSGGRSGKVAPLAIERGGMNVLCVHRSAIIAVVVLVVNAYDG
jgi:hypothetical protein